MSTPDCRHVVVIGAGLSGLAAACHLLGAGYRVTVLERDADVGGRAGRIERDGYAFDTGPTVMTMPELLAESFEAVGANMAELLTLRRLDPAYRACFADGSTLRVRADLEASIDEVRATCGPADAAALRDFAGWLRGLYELEMPNFIARNFDRPTDLAWPPGPALRLLRSGALASLRSIVRRRFRDERLRRLLSFQALYAGLSPVTASGIYAVITYMDVIAGVYAADGGMHAIPAAMAAAVRGAGGEIVTGAPVERILLADGPTGAVRGVGMADGRSVDADAVVCTVDTPVAYRELLPGLHPPRRVGRPRYSPSAVVWHVGTRGAPGPEVAHHNIHFGREWGPSFRALIRDGRLMPDPSLLVSVPTLTDPSLAPSGSSVLYVLEPVPNTDGQVDWAQERPRMQDRLAGRLVELGYPLDVVVDEFVDPRDWESAGMQSGTPFALAHTFAQTGPFRPPNVHRKAPGLVFAGSGTVPGVGVPMVLISGKLAAERIVAMDTPRDAGSKPARHPARSRSTTAGARA